MDTIRDALPYVNFLILSTDRASVFTRELHTTRIRGRNPRLLTDCSGKVAIRLECTRRPAVRASPVDATGLDLVLDLLVLFLTLGTDLDGE